MGGSRKKTGMTVFSRTFPRVASRVATDVPFFAITREGPARSGGTLITRHQGGYKDGDPPLPIPNREVKPAVADGTAQAGE